MQQRQTTSVGGAPVQGLNCFRRWAVSPSNSLNQWRNLSCVSGLEGLSALGAPHKAGCPSSAPPPSPLSIFKTQNMETFVETLPPSQLLPLPGPDSQPNRSGWRSRPIAKSLQGIKSTLDGQFQNLVMTMLETPISRSPTASASAPPAMARIEVGLSPITQE